MSPLISLQGQDQKASSRVPQSIIFTLGTGNIILEMPKGNQLYVGIKLHMIFKTSLSHIFFIEMRSVLFDIILPGKQMVFQEMFLLLLLLLLQLQQLLFPFQLQKLLLPLRISRISSFVVIKSASYNIKISITIAGFRFENICKNKTWCLFVRHCM